MTRPKGMPPPPPQVDNVGKIIAFLKKNPEKTIAEIAVGVGLPEYKVRNAMARQRYNKPGEVFRICEWRKQGQCTDLGVYECAFGDDEPRPLKDPKSQKAQQRSREREKRRQKRVEVVARNAPIEVPLSMTRTRFVGGINPWTQQRMEA